MSHVLRSGLVLHEQIKLKLIRDVLNPDGVDEKAIKSDRSCVFGQWIYDPGNEHSARAEFQRFKAAHLKFHLAAHQAYCLSKSARLKEALDFIDKGAFETTSQEMKASLVDLRSALLCEPVSPE